MILLDIIPTIEHFEKVNMDFAMGYYHWFWLAQRNPIPESVIQRAPGMVFCPYFKGKKRQRFFCSKCIKRLS